MGNFLLLKESNRCPGCHRKTIGSTHCNVCGTRIFKHGEPDVARLNQDGVMNWWAFDARGWVHADFFRIAEAKPLDRHFEAPKLAKDYGTKLATPARSRRIRRKD